MKNLRNTLRTAVAIIAGTLLCASVMAQPQGVGLERAAAVKAARVGQLLGMEGVVGAGVGLDDVGQGAVHVLVADNAAAARVPRRLDGVPVVVKVTGRIMALGAEDAAVAERAGGGKPGGGTRIDPTGYFARPVPIGVSTGNATVGTACSAGTIGCRVKDSSGKVYALSNNHVYARENAAAIDEEIAQPGPYDTGCYVSPDYHLGKLADFAEIDFSGGMNVVDAAIAFIDGDYLGNATPANGYGAPESTTVSTTVAAGVGQPVQKYGRTTGLTQGTVDAINVTIYVGYGRGTAVFNDQIQVYARKAFIKAGDSGSLLVTNPGATPVGLLFAGNQNGQYAFANPIGPVLTALKVSIDGK